MKARNKAVVIVGMIILGSFTGCAHSALNQRVDAKLVREDNVKGRADLQGEAQRFIQSDAKLSNDQKAKLAALLELTKSQTDEVIQRSLKLRSILIKDLLAENYDQNEVDLIKKRLGDVEKQRLNLMFVAVAQANTILGHQTLLEHQALMDDYLMGEFDRGTERLH